MAQSSVVDRRMISWANSGGLWLTGRREGPPLGPSAQLLELLDHLGARLGIDVWPLVGERAAVAGLARNGSTSCGGATRLLPAADGWIALALARDDDVAGLPAWLEADVDPARDTWTVVGQIVEARSAAVLDERAALLGLPAARVGRLDTPDREAPTVFGLPAGGTTFGPARAGGPRSQDGALVVDLSALWAGPLATELLAEAGARVVKVESLRRPDGARNGPPDFYDLLNGRKSSVALDLARPDDVDRLRHLLARADVVVEGSRPRAMEQLGIHPGELLADDDGPTVWVSITGYGRRAGWRDRVAFGDVAAAAGGLLAHDDAGPCFLADAIADPLAGLVAAAATVDALASGRRWLLDVALAGVAAGAAGEPLDPGTVVAAPPRARPVRRRARPLGADTEAVLAALAS